MPETAYAWTVEGEVMCGPLQRWARDWEHCHYSALSICDPVAIIPNPDPTLPPTIAPARLESELGEAGDGWRVGVWTSVQGDRVAWRLNLNA